jgi:type VI secretion system activator RovC-like protein/transcriptional regulator
MDWRNDADYAYLQEPPGTDAAENPTGMIHERWAWEFLRRNADYQREWEQLLARGAADEIIRQEGFTRDHPHLYIYSQPYSQPPLESQKWGLVVYCNPKTPQPRSLCFPRSFGRIISGSQLKYLQRKSGPPDPMVIKRSIRGGLLEHFRRDTTVTRHDLRRQSYPLWLEQEQAAAIFDLSQPLDPQLKVVGASLRRHQKNYREKDEIAYKVPRRHVENWVRYLRALDARAAGASLDDIAEVLLPYYSNAYLEYTGRKRAVDTLQQARTLVDGGYRKILLPTA